MEPTIDSNDEKSRKPSVPEGNATNSKIAQRKFINLDYLEKVSPGNHKFFEEMMVTFQSESTAFIDKIGRHLNEKDFLSICKTAHAMKPMGSYIGVDDLTKLVGRLEKQSRNADTNGTSILFKEISEMIEAVNREITHYLNLSK